MRDPTEIVDEMYGLISDSETDIALNNALTRLRTNPDFIRVIEKGYLTDLALELVKCKGRDSCVAYVAEMVDKELTSIGRLNFYFESIEHTAMIAQKSIVDANRAIDEIESE